MDLDPIVVAYFLRHGTTSLNALGKFRGDKDVPLDAKGKQDAEQQRKFIQPIHFGSVFSSDLDRAETTTRIVVGPKTPVEKTPELRPLDVGDLAGKKKSEHLAQIKEIQKDHNLKLPGSKESLNDFGNRIRHPILKALHAGVRTGRPSLIFTHSSVIHGLGELLHSNHEHNLVKPGGIVQVVFVPHPAGGDFIARAVFKAKNSPDGYAS